MKTSTLKSAKIVIFDLGVLKVIVDLENKQINKNTDKKNYYSECVEEWNKRTIGDLVVDSKYTFGQFLFQIVNGKFYGAQMQLWYNVFGNDGIKIIE